MDGQKLTPALRPSPLIARLLLIGVVAAALRVASRLYLGADDLWVSGYTIYFDLAQSVADGRGFSLLGAPTLIRVPLYPLLLATVSGGSHAFWPVVLTQSIIGGMTVVAAGVLAFELFKSPVTAVTAAGVTAIYPYYVVHDTALQETGLFTLFTLLSVIALVRVQRRCTIRAGVCAGIVLGLTLLVRATLVPFAGLAPFILFASGSSASVRMRLRSAAALALAMAFVLSPWVMRSYALTGSPVLVSETGNQLWSGNNPSTFTVYPEGSIDAAVGRAYKAMTDTDWNEIKARTGNEVLVDHWFLARAVDYIREHPLQFAVNALRKLAAALSPIPSPRRGLVTTLGHACSYGGVLLLALYGAALGWPQRRDQLFVYANIACFLVVTGVFFGHTSHRAYIDVYLIVFAAYALVHLCEAVNARLQYAPFTAVRPLRESGS